VALRRILALGDFEYVWLLNNDTVVPPDALRHLMGRMKEKPAAGLCGSTLCFYAMPERVQALAGAAYSRWLGIARLVTASRAPATPEEVETRLAYVMAASLLVSRPFLEEVGLLSEDYFLFFEELDWATRARGRYSLAYAPMSIVYHKGGSSTGSRDPYHSLTDFYMTRSQLLYARKHTPWALPFVLVRHGLVALHSLLRGRLGRIRTLLRAYADLLGCDGGRRPS
jgi:GT2 family glycosyltransferase